MMETFPRVRFAPSPTGYLHVGGARTAIFNLLHARRFGGSMILRVEDTDLERSEQRHTEQILRSMEWLGIEWDEGPFLQSERLDLYRQNVETLLAEGKAYRCYCSLEELSAERQQAEAEKRAFRYSGKCREGREDVGEDSPSVVRFRVPSGEPVVVEDQIRGEVTVARDVLDDFVLVRADGSPTYHLSVVSDDIDMGVTLVARGEDHLSNTPKHILLFEALGGSVPSFAHLPLILGPDRKRLSKRTGATSVEEFRDQGILPEALFNFLMLLGWSPGDDQEIISREEATARFQMGDVNKSAAVFDVDKLFWMNGQYLAETPVERIRELIAPFIDFEVGDAQKLDQVLELSRSRSRTLVDLAAAVKPFFVGDEEIEYDPNAVKKHLRGERLGERIEKLAEIYRDSTDFTIEGTETALREAAEQMGVGAGKLIHPLRLAVTGRGVSPPVFDVIVAVGRERTVSRLEKLRDWVRDNIEA